MARNRLILLSSFTVTCGIVCKVIRDEIRLANRRKKRMYCSRLPRLPCGVWSVTNAAARQSNSGMRIVEREKENDGCQRVLLQRFLPRNIS